MHLHTFDMRPFGVKEPSVMIIHFFDGRILDVRNRRVIAYQHFVLCLKRKVRIRNDTFEHSYRAFECVLVADMEDQVEVGYLSRLVAISLEVEKGRGRVEPRKARNEIRLVHD